MIKLQLGAGGNILPGWINTDINPLSPNVLHMDFTQRLPLEDNSVDRIYSEHTIEHVAYTEAVNSLRECFRVLKPGGRIRICCPNLAWLLRLYTDPNDQDWNYMTQLKPSWAPEPDPVFTINEFVRAWGHQFIWDARTLTKTLEGIGFTQPLRCDVRVSHDPEFRNLEIVTRMPPGFLQLESMTIEAKKP